MRFRERMLLFLSRTEVYTKPRVLAMTTMTTTTANCAVYVRIYPAVGHGPSYVLGGEWFETDIPGHTYGRPHLPTYLFTSVPT